MPEPTTAAVLPSPLPQAASAVSAASASAFVAVSIAGAAAAEAVAAAATAGPDPELLDLERRKDIALFRFGKAIGREKRRTKRSVGTVSGGVALPFPSTHLAPLFLFFFVAAFSLSIPFLQSRL